MVEYTAEAMPGTIEVVRPVAPGDGMVRADEDVAAGAELVPAGRPLRAQDLGLLAAAGVTAVPVHARPAGGDRLHRRRGGAAGDRGAAAGPGAGRDRRRRWPRWSPDAGGEPVPAGHRPGRRGRAGAGAARRARRRRPGRRLGRVLGRRPGRDRRRGGRARRPGSCATGWRSSRASRPLLAECGGVPVIGLPGNPLSALVVFRLVGVPLVRRVGGCHDAAARAGHAGPAGPRGAVGDRAARRRPGRACRDGVAEPVFGPSALLSVLTSADGYVVVPEAATGLAARHRGRRDPVPMTEAGQPVRPRRPGRRRPWRPGGGACAAAGLPARGSPAVCVPVADAVGRVTAEPVWARRSSPAFDAAAMDGIAVRAADTVGATETTPLLLRRRLRGRRHRRPDAGRARRGRHARARAPRRRTARAELRAAVPPYQHVRSIGEDVSASELLLPEGHRLRAGRRGRGAAAGVAELRGAPQRPGW